MVLKIKDAAGNVREIKVLKGEAGRDYVLTDADKRKIAEEVYEMMQSSKVKVTITSLWNGIDGDTASITVTSPEAFSVGGSSVKTWTAYVYDEPDCTIEIPAGSTIACQVTDTKSSNRCYVTLNGAEVLSDPGTYTYTVTGDVSIHLEDEYSQGEYGKITITE